MTGAPTIRHPRLLTRAWLVLLLLSNLAIAAIGLQVLNEQRHGSGTTPDTGALEMWGVSAAIGVVTVALALVASFAGRAGRGMSDIAWGVAWLRLIALPVVAVSIAASFGLNGLSGGFVVVVAIAEAATTLVCAGAVRRQCMRLAGA
ncbi:hypothetical protein GCM10010168_46120 [Actinoplanes ianthinogenes]|uniref:Integral membrane protein n=1 Tax=Actinoplanes ianthinogenes TaxID=122358 RepID=A0ABM7LPF2_9ACTN|nr:hypothetical protein [Actinoplanes ianthinogenes]BCJ41090.1 hypothetical protein Aiant_17470 [Actinoplanes ianthinogenes]GGR22968.1 hypothetical protein GCM10010168_46120 [Actinoplanes ianthinogenes]